MDGRWLEGRREGELFFNGFRVSVWEDEEVPERTVSKVEQRCEGT